MRTIKEILPSQRVNMGGILLNQPLPYGNIEQINPFLLLHHWNDGLPGNQHQRDVGVDPHPHRGFAPVTMVFKGGVHHRDSRGNQGEVREWGTQWMNSGMGIIHSERPVKDLVENGGDFEFIQFWVNSPSLAKMKQPEYQQLTGEETPRIKLDNDKVELGVVAGEFNGIKGKINTASPLIVLRVDFEAGGKLSIPILESYNAFIYQLDGKLNINKQTTIAKDLTWFKNDGKTIEIEAKEATRTIVLAGEPINEPLKTYGPFVMNTQPEIMEALRDYQMGKMGILIEEFE